MIPQVEAEQLDLFRENLPNRPYCTEELGALSIRDQRRALTHSYIQHNPPAMIFWLVADVDHDQAGAAWLDAMLPPPAWIAQNRDTGSAHVAYGLAVPVCRSDAARLAPLRLADAVERGLWESLGADTGYAGLITKNPCHPRWRVLQPAANAGLYDLNELAEYVPLRSRPRKPELAGLGRNCCLFDQLRHWAYCAIRQGWPDAEQWHRAVLDRAEGYNNFTEPLPYSEVRATARSVAKYTHKHFSPAGFSAWQAEQGAKGGKASKGGGRPRITTANGEPWLAEGVSRATWYRRRAHDK